MPLLKELCTMDVACCGKTTTVAEAARLMRQHHIGDLVVADDSDGTREPIGILTDRDIVTKVVAQQRDPATTVVAEIMTAPLVVAAESEDTETAIERMRSHGVRRLPVVDDAGTIVGILTLDDFHRFQAERAAALVAVVTQERTHEVRGRR